MASQPEGAGNGEASPASSPAPAPRALSDRGARAGARAGAGLGEYGAEPTAGEVRVLSGLAGLTSPYLPATFLCNQPCGRPHCHCHRPHHAYWPMIKQLFATLRKRKGALSNNPTGWVNQ